MAPRPKFVIRLRWASGRLSSAGALTFGEQRKLGEVRVLRVLGDVAVHPVTRALGPLADGVRGDAVAGRNRVGR